MNPEANEERQRRLELAKSVALEAGDLAVDYFARLSSLEVHSKGLQDYVTEADRQVELFLRDRISARFPDDGTIGEEHGTSLGSSGYIWVVDPIDGTSNFVRGSSDWCVAICVVEGNEPIVAVTHDPTRKVSYWAAKDMGAFVNDKRVRVSSAKDLSEGTTAIGYSNRLKREGTVSMFGNLLSENARIFHNASGALMLANVAAGTLLGFSEAHMNPWDCMGGLLMATEAEGLCLDYDREKMLKEGGRVIAACPGVFETLVRVTEDSYGPA